MKIFCQRAANGGSDPSWLNLAFLGRPDFQSKGPKIHVFKGFWDRWTENRGAPKTPNSTTTDLTPHLRPSDFGWVPMNSGNRSGSCSENCGVRIAQVVGCHSESGFSYSENGISNSESCSENTPELSESSENSLFTPRAFFLKLGWSPGF